jgi:hypothetical protein
MGVEGEYRPGGEQFAERSASDQAFAVGDPVDLVGSIWALVEEERANRSNDFNPAWWLRGEINAMFEEAIAQNEPEEKQDFYYTLRAAWSLVAYEQIDGEHNKLAYEAINGYTHVYRSETIRLSPSEVALLDAMAEALEIPDHTPGQVEFDISLFSDQVRWEKIETKAESIYPTVEDVKRAIIPQRKT